MVLSAFILRYYGSFKIHILSTAGWPYMSRRRHRKQVRTQTYMPGRIHTCNCRFPGVSVRIAMCMHKEMCTYCHVYICVYICILYVYIYIHSIYIYIYIYIYI